MNTIPLIFNERQIQRAVIGGTRKPAAVRIPVSVILLNDGTGRYKTGSLETLVQCGFESIVSIQNFSENYAAESLAQLFPTVKFIMPQEPVTEGDCINIGMEEVAGDFVLVLREGIHVSANMIPERLAERMLQADKLCICPMLVSPAGQTLPVQADPYIEKNTLAFRPSAVLHEGSPTAYPFGRIGLYDRRRFIMLGGYDYTITSPYWQNLDFALRAWLWGESFAIMPSFRLGFEEDPVPEDTTADESQLRFFLKNVAPRFKNDCAYIPVSRYFSYAYHAAKNIFRAYHDFSDARRWVQKNRFRFKTDILSLIEYWETSE